MGLYVITTSEVDKLKMVKLYSSPSNLYPNVTISV